QHVHKTGRALYEKAMGRSNTQTCNPIRWRAQPESYPAFDGVWSTRFLSFSACSFSADSSCGWCVQVSPRRLNDISLRALWTRDDGSRFNWILAGSAFFRMVLNPVHSNSPAGDRAPSFGVFDDQNAYRPAHPAPSGSVRVSLSRSQYSPSWRTAWTNS